MADAATDLSQQPNNPNQIQGRKVMATAAIIVVNYASAELIGRNLDPQVVRDADAQVILVDNFSNAQQRDVARRLAAQHDWVLVEQPNTGFSGGCNAGVAKAREIGADVDLLLNPDAVITLDVLQAMLTEAREHPNALIGVRITTSDGGPQYRGSTINLTNGHIKTGWATPEQADLRNWITGAALACTVDAYERCGGMDDDYFLYWEDVDFGVRAHEAGVELRLRTDLIVLHDEGGTQQHTSRAKSNTYYRYNARNRLVFGRKHVPERWAAWVRATPRESYAIWLRGGRRQLLTQPLSVVATIRGSLEGLLWRPRKP